MIHFALVSPFVLLIALMASPILGILFAAFLAQSSRTPSLLRSFAWLPAALGAGVALCAAWALRGQPFETTIGNWSPVSFTGLPLALAVYTPSLTLIIAWVTVYFISSLRLPNADPFVQHPAASSLIVASLTITALGHNLISILVGLGLTDLLSAYLALRRQKGERNMLIGFVMNGLSIALLLIVVAVHYAGGNSLQLPLARLSQTATPLLALAIALRLGFAPFRSSPEFLGDLRTAGSVASGFLVLIRLPSLGITQLPAWFYALGLASALLTLAIGILKAGSETTALMPFLITAGAYLASASAAVAIPGVTAAAVVAWLLGATLVNQSGNGAGSVVDDAGRALGIRLAVRIVGALCLIGLPLTVGFIGSAGIAATWVRSGVGGLLLTLGWLIALALLGYGLLNVVLGSMQRTPQERLIEDRTRWFHLSLLRDVLGWLAAVAPIMLFGIAPVLLNAGSFSDAVSRNGVAGWLATLAAVALAFMLWQSRLRWQPTLHRARERTITILQLEWFHSLLGGAAARLRSPFSHVFTFLESDGALIWAVIVALLLVLISRPGGP